MVVVQSLFHRDETGAYAAAGMIGRGLYFFTIPLSAVMFPKIVRSKALAEKTDVVIYVLLCTALLGGSAALFCTLFPKFPLQLIYQKKYLEIAWLVPWFCWSMLPLTLAAVLIHDLMARSHYRVVPYLLLVPAAYFTTLTFIHSDFAHVVQVLGIFNLLLLGIAFLFNRLEKEA